MINFCAVGKGLGLGWVGVEWGGLLSASTLRDECKYISSALAQQDGGSVVVMGGDMGVEGSG
jgi:hypothetical protein